MRALFVGSLDITRPNFDTIQQNLKNLVKLMARNNAHFVIRDVKRDTKPRIPIDQLIYDALTEYFVDPSKAAGETITLYKEPGVYSGFNYSLPHVSHSATTSYRLEFYKELLNLVDLVIGVGGELGLMRISISSEWFKKPFLVLPGSGDTSEFLWQEFFKKSHQLVYLSEGELLSLKKMPYIDEVNVSYAETTYEIIRAFQKSVARGVSKSPEFMTPDNITLATAASSMRRFSIGLWLAILTFLSALVSVSYYLGSLKLFP